VKDITPLLNYPTRDQCMLLDAEPRDQAMPSVGRARGHSGTFSDSSRLSLRRTRGRGELFAEPTPSNKKIQQ
jgi:hypothetical protein